MKPTWPLALAVLACSCATSTDRAATLREEYRRKAVDPAVAARCRKAPELCGGYAGTYWTMPMLDVQSATGCTWSGEVCSTARERYVFRGGGLSGVFIPYRDWLAGRAELVSSLGEPGWEGSNTEGFESRIAEARHHERSVIGGAMLGDAFGAGLAFGLFLALKARDEREALEAKQAATVPMRCAAWQRELTQVVLCEENGKTTTALFTSRTSPETATRVGDFNAAR